MMELGVFVQGAGTWRSDFERALSTQCEALELTARLGEFHAGAPARLALFFASEACPDVSPDAAALDAYLQAGRVVIPVIERPEHAPTHLPKVLSTHNAFITSRYGDHWPEVLVDEVLSHLWLSRRVRRMFLSYLRKESAGIAHQLHEHFVRLGYDVFLDTCSVAVGADFQRELTFRLNDADVVLLLVSPGLERSTWVAEEVSFANGASIGVVGVLWPEAAYQRAGTRPGVTGSLERDQRHRLEDADFRGDPTHEAGRELSNDAVRAIEAMVTRYRARGIRVRLLSLLPYATAHLSDRFIVKPGTELGALELIAHDTLRPWKARVVPFRPTPEVLHDIYKQADGHPELAGAGCLYAENDPHEPRAAALKWLANAEHAPGSYRLWPFTGKKSS